MIFRRNKPSSPSKTPTNQDGQGGETALPDTSKRHGAVSGKPDGLVENAVALATGLSMADAHYPGHDPIDYYGDGGFRFGDMSHQGSLMFLPSGIHRWDVTEPARITAQSLEKVIKESNNIEILLIGTGKQLIPITPELRQLLRDNAIMADVMDTGAAVRTLNILLAEERAVAAAILAVD